MNIKYFAAALVLAFVAVSARAQHASEHDLSVGLRYSATRAQTLPGTCCFYLQGGTADAALPVLPHISAVVEAGGATMGRVANTSRGLSTLTLLAGPRYTLATGPRVTLAAQGLFGAVRGFDADFTTANHMQNTATAFAYAVGGFAQYRLASRLRLRLAQVDYLQTNLPNGADNRQRNIRLGAGVTFTVSLPQSRR